MSEKRKSVLKGTCINTLIVLFSFVFNLDNWNGHEQREKSKSLMGKMYSKAHTIVNYLYIAS